VKQKTMEDTLEMKRPKLLVADDSVTIRKVVELTFAEEGVDVFAAGDGEGAMKKFVEVEPDIVLVDVNMPDPAGYQICEMIKQDETTRDIPVLLLVGSFEPFDTAEAERVGADGFLTKPFQSVRDLVGRVTELLGNSGNGNGNAMPAPPAETADIQDLYESSFPEPYRTEESKDTVLGDAGMDDELIETSHREGGPDPIDSSHESVHGQGWLAGSAAASAAEPAASSDLETEDDLGWLGVTAPTGADVMSAPHEAPKFDEADTEQLAASIDELEPKPYLQRVVDDFDDTLEVQKPAAGQVDTIETTESQPEAELPSLRTGDTFDEQAETAAQSGPEAISHEPAPAADAGRDLSELRIPEHPHEREDDPAVYIPSEEFIDIIARRVVEKLSDKAVRDVAREAVPRIAEKLIREALDQDKK
jgi:CheY-like chemotaxis protein